MKKALLTTTALVALSGAAFADSVAVRNGGTSHHTHAPTVVFHGEANIKYNLPLKTVVGDTPDGVIASDVDLDVTMTSPGQYSATVSYGMEGNNIAGATVTVVTPVAEISVGRADARGGAGAGADAADLFSEVGDMSGIGEDEDNSDWYVKVPFGGWTVAASGYADDTDNPAGRGTGGMSENSSIGLTGSVGGLKVTAGGMGDSGGASISTNLMGATVTVAAANMKQANGTTVQESGIGISIPVSGVTLDLDTSTVDGTSHWGASAKANVSGFTVTVGTGSDENNKVKITGSLTSSVALHLEYESSTDNLTFDTEDPTIEAGVTYSVPGTKGTTISASYSNDDDDFDPGTQVKMAFKF